MDKQQQAIFEARSILIGHLDLLMRLAGAGLQADSEIMSQLERARIAAQNYLALPRPAQQQAA